MAYGDYMKTHTLEHLRDGNGSKYFSITLSNGFWFSVVAEYIDIEFFKDGKIGNFVFRDSGCLVSSVCSDYVYDICIIDYFNSDLRTYIFKKGVLLCQENGNKMIK